MLRWIPIGLIFLSCRTATQHSERSGFAEASVDAPQWSVPVRGEAPVTETMQVDAEAQVTNAHCTRLDALNSKVTRAPRDHGGLFVAVRNGSCAPWTNGATGHEVFRLASLTKTVIATLALRAVDQGRLKLDTPLDEVLPGVPEARHRTLRMLLSHTSGLVSYDAAPGFWSQTSQARTPLQLLALGRSLQHGTPSSQGAPFRYANANYTLLGIALESIYEKSLDAQLEDLLHPLGIRSIRKEPVQSAHEPMYTAEGKETGTHFRPWMLFAAGDLVGSLEDVVTWTQIWGRGTFLSEGSRKAWLTTVATHEANLGYGLGVYLRNSRAGVTTRSHAGRLSGLNLTMTYDPDHDVAIAAVSTREGIETAPVTETILRALQ